MTRQVIMPRVAPVIVLNTMAEELAAGGAVDALDPDMVWIAHIYARIHAALAASEQEG